MNAGRAQINASSKTAAPVRCMRSLDERERRTQPSQEPADVPLLCDTDHHLVVASRPETSSRLYDEHFSAITRPALNHLDASQDARGIENNKQFTMVERPV